MILVSLEQVWRYLGGLLVLVRVNVKYIYKHIFIIIVAFRLFMKD